MVSDRERFVLTAEQCINLIKAELDRAGLIVDVDTLREIYNLLLDRMKSR